MAAAHSIHRLQMLETQCPDLAAVGRVGTIGDEIDAEFAFRSLYGRVDLAFRTRKPSV